MSEIEQRIKTKIESAGLPLRDWDVKIFRGVLTGYNEAFIINGITKEELIKADPKSAEIIRPILRGRDIKRYEYKFADLWLINTHNGIKEKDLNPIDIDNYPAVKTHLHQYYSSLEKRADKGDTPYNLRNCAYMDDFFRQKIVWGNLNLTASYSLAEAGMFINAPCTMIVPGDPYLLAMLNSKLGDYYIRNLGVMRNGGYFEYKPMFIEQLPVPVIDKTKQAHFTSLMNQIIELKKNNLNAEKIEREVDLMVFELYNLSPEEINYLLSDGSGRQVEVVDTIDLVT